MVPRLNSAGIAPDSEGKQKLLTEFYPIDEQSIGIQAVPRTKTRGCQAVVTRRDKSTQTAKK